MFSTNLGGNVNCYRCESELSFEMGDKIGRQDECDKCKVNLRCCKMCEFYDNLVYNECKEPNAERILDKEKANFCGYFILSGTGTKSTQTRDDMLAAANALFKN